MDPVLFSRILVITVFTALAAWFVAGEVRGILRYARRHQTIVANWPRSQALRQASREQRQALEALGFTDDELHCNHLMRVDPETGISTAVYGFAQAEVAARAELLMRRYAAAYSAQLGIAPNRP